MEKRKNKRFLKRLTVRYGEQELTHSGMTFDLSTNGAFIVGSHLPAIHSRVHVQLISGKTAMYLEGLVCRQRMVPPQLRQIERGGFAVRFLSPGELLGEAAPHPEAETHFEVVFLDREQLVKAWQQELRFGGVFLRTETRLSPDTQVTVKLRLDFSAQTFEAHARVIQVMAATVNGLAVSFVDKAQVQRQLAPFLQ